MDDNFKLLDLNDEDVLYFSDNSLFKFGYLKNKITSEIQTGATSQRTINTIRNQFTSWSINNLHGCQANDITIKLLLPSDSKECEILRLGYQRWQKGKLLVEVDLNYSAVSDEPNNQPQWEIQEINFYFKPDEPEISQPESPLDDLRQRINQENQPENQ